MKISKYSFSNLVILVLAVAWGVSGCGGSDQSRNPPGTDGGIDSGPMQPDDDTADDDSADDDTADDDTADDDTADDDTADDDTADDDSADDDTADDDTSDDDTADDDTSEPGDAGPMQVDSGPEPPRGDAGPSGDAGGLSVDSVTVELDEDDSVTVDLADLGPEVDGISFEITDPPDHGALTSSGTSWTYTPEQDFHGTDSFRFVARLGTKSSAAGTVTLNVLSINDPPQAAPDTETVEEGGTLQGGSVLDNDVDVDGDELTVTPGPVTAPLYGTLDLASDGTFTYQHDGSEESSDSFEYEVCDPSDECDTAIVSLAITAVDDVPVALPDAYTLQTGALLTVVAPGLVDNDVDPEGEPLTVTTTPVMAPASGTLTLMANGAFTYQHDGSASTSDGFTYEVCDPQGSCADGDVTLTIQPPNSTLVAMDDSYALQEGGTLNTAPASVLDNDDKPGAVLLVTPTPVTAPSNGTLTLRGDGTFTYVHDGSNTTSDSFQYEVCDSTGDCAVATVTLQIGAVDDPPITSADDFSVDEGALLDFGASVLDNDVDPEGSSLTAVLGDAPLFGTLDFQDDGTFAYQHDGSEEPSDSFTYLACDTTANCTEETVTLTINPINDPPIARDDTYAVLEGGTISVTTILLTNNDEDPEGSVLTVTATPIEAPAVGTLVLNADGSFTYTHQGDSPVAQQFRYEVCDDEGACAEAVAVISIFSTNDPPVAGADSFTLDEGGTLDTTPTSVMENDSDPDNFTLAVRNTPAVAPQFGTLTLRADGTFRYVHDGSENFTDTFEYQLCDSGELCSNGLVTLTINPLNDAPQAVTDSYAVDEGGTLNVSAAPGVLANDIDPEGDPLTPTLVSMSGPTNGSLTFNADGSFEYVHFGGEDTSDSFQYEICDTEPLCTTGTVNLTINPVNDPPTAQDDGTFPLVQGDTVMIGDPGLLGNDNDVDPGDQLTASVVTDPVNGTVTVNSGGGFTYVHDDSRTTTDSFTYEACDTASACDTATVTFAIELRNQPPVPATDAYTVAEGGTLNVNAMMGVLANDTDPDGNMLSATPATETLAHGSLMLLADGSFVYTHDGDEPTGTEEFTYEVCDTEMECEMGVVMLTVTPVNDPPVANDDAFYEVDEGATLTIPAMGMPGLLANDGDVDSTTLQVSTVPIVSPDDGVLTLSPDGSFTYAHNGDEPPMSGTVVFVYEVCDDAPTPACDQATATITIHAVDDPAIAEDDDYTATPATGHVAFSIAAANGVLGNDSDPDSMGALTVCPQTNGMTNQGGLVNLAADGSFTYLPPANVRNAMDGFEYHLNEGDCAGMSGDMGSVAIQIGSAVVWHVDVLSGGFDDGRGSFGGESHGFQTLAGLSGATGSMQSGDLIVIYRGGGVTSTSSLTIPEGVTIVGHGVSLPDTTRFPAAQFPALNLPHFALIGDEADPTQLSNSSGHVLALAGDNVVAGIDLMGSATNPAIISSDGSVGTVHLDDVDISGAAAGGIQLNNTTHGGSLTIHNSNIAATGGTGIDLNNVAAFNVDTDEANLADRNMTVDNTGGPAVRIRSTGSIATNAVFASLNSVNATTEGVLLDHLSGTFRVKGTTLSQPSSGGVGVRIDNTAGGGTLTFAGNVDVDSVAGHAMSLTGNAGNLTFSANTSLTTTGGGTGLLMASNSAGLALTFSGELDVATTTGDAVSGSGSGSFTATNAGNSINAGAGRFALSGMNLNINFPLVTITSSTHGIRLDGTSGSSTFSGLNVTTTGGTALYTTNAGTLHVPETGTGGATNTLSSSAASVVRIESTTIGGNGTTGGVNLRSVSAGSAGGSMIQDGIILNSTGVGRFRVTGDGINQGSGGLIQRATDRGAEIVSAQNVSLAFVNFVDTGTVDGPSGSCGNSLVPNTGCNGAIHLQTVTNVTLHNVTTNRGQYGINGNAVTNLVLTDSLLNDHGDESEEDGIRFFNLHGTSRITGTTVQNSRHNNLYVMNSAATPLSLTVGGTGALRSQFINAGKAVVGQGNDGLLFEGLTGTDMTLDVNNCVFNRSDGDHVQTAVSGTAMMDVTIQNNDMDAPNDGGSPVVLGSGITMASSADFSGQVTLDISNNDIQHSNAKSINVNLGTTTGTGVYEGQIVGNIIGTAGTGDSGGAGVDIVANGSGTVNLLVSGNQIREFDDFEGISIIGRDGSPTVNVDLLNNTVGNTSSCGVNCFERLFVSAGATSGDAPAFCVHIQGNTLSGATGASDFRLRQRFNSTFNLPGYTGMATNTASVISFVSGNNTVGSGSASVDSVGFTGIGTTCLP